MFHTHGVVFLCVCERVIRAAPWVLRDKKGGKERKTGPHHGPVGVVKGPGRSELGSKECSVLECSLDGREVNCLHAS